MDSLIGRLGNEVRQTIYHVTGMLELVGEEPVTATQSQYLLRCRESVDHLLRTASDLAELARPGAVSLRPSLFNVADAVGEISDLMGVLAIRKGLTFDCAVDPTVPARIISDKILLQDTLRRLLDNAIRYTETGGIRILVTAAEHGPEWVVLAFEVADTGPGIESEVLSSDVESLLSGVPLQGLGLLIVRNRLTGLGGEMSVISNSNSGTTLRMTISAAIAQIDDPHAGATAPTNGRASSHLRLLIAEDSNDSFILFQSFMKAEGHRITRALNGAEAVEMAKSGDYNFIVMDANMPVMDGYTAIRLIRAWETEQGRVRLPILLISADELDTQIRIGAEAGCSGYLTKPTTKAQVLAALQFYANPARIPDLI